MIPNNYPGCREAYQKWKDLGDGTKENEEKYKGHRDSIWACTNAKIDEINALAKVEYIRQNGDDKGFCGIQHIFEEEYQHLAAWMWAESKNGPAIEYEIYTDLSLSIENNDVKKLCVILANEKIIEYGYVTTPYKDGVVDYFKFAQLIIEDYEYSKQFIRN